MLFTYSISDQFEEVIAKKRFFSFSTFLKFLPTYKWPQEHWFVPPGKQQIYTACKYRFKLNYNHKYKYKCPQEYWLVPPDKYIRHCWEKLSASASSTEVLSWDVHLYFKQVCTIMSMVKTMLIYCCVWAIDLSLLRHNLFSPFTWFKILSFAMFWYVALHLIY